MKLGLLYILILMFCNGCGLWMGDSAKDHPGNIAPIQSTNSVQNPN
jgi:hypothetical protein